MEKTQTDDELRIGLIDPNAIIRSGLRSVIAGEDDFRLCAESASREAALPGLTELALHVIVLGIEEATEPGIEDIITLKSRCTGTALVVFADFRSEAYLVRTLLAGAGAFLISDSSPSNIVSGIRTAHDKENLLVPRELLLSTLKAIQCAGESSSLPALGPARLTERERQVLEQMATGAAYKVIAETLYLAESTVKKYAHNVITKLGAENRIAAVVKASKLNLVRPPDERKQNGSTPSPGVSGPPKECCANGVA